MITLIIVGCQNDYVTGTTSSRGTKSVIEEIKKFIKSHKKEIDKIIIAAEWHPYNHMSFKKYGGNQPHHCIQFTPGACIEPKLLKIIQSLEIDYEVSTRGEIEEVDQIGAFNEIEFVTDELGQRYYFDSLATADANTDFVVCGIAEKDSIKNTISNLITGEIFPKVFVPGIFPSINDFIEEHKIEKVNV